MTSRLSRPQMVPVYSAAKRFVDAVLRKDDSLFTPGRPIWSRPVIDDSYTRFVEHADAGEDPFWTKLRRQLDGAPPGTVQLIAELLYVHLLGVYDMKPSTKRDQALRVLGWSSQPVSIPDDLDEAFATGVGSFGPARIAKWYHMRLLLEFVRHWKGLPASRQATALADPWEFKRVLWEVPPVGGDFEREALLHLVFPDTFEPSVGPSRKAAIARYYGRLVTQPTEDIDRQLVQIRAGLSTQFGPDFDFSDPSISSQWGGPRPSWDVFVEWAERLWNWAGFEAEERKYKLVVAERLAQARNALLGGSSDWIDLLKKAMGKPNNLITWRLGFDFTKWCQEEPEAAASALRVLWDTDLQPSYQERVRRFAELAPQRAHSGQRAIISSILLMGVDPTAYPVYRPVYYSKGYALTGYGPIPEGADVAKIYEHALGFLDQILSEAQARGLPLRDRLDAQGVLWAVTSWPPEQEPIKSWSRRDRRALLEYRSEQLPDDIEEEGEEGGGDAGGEQTPGGGSGGKPEVDRLARVAERLSIDATHVREIEQLLADKRQAIFYGPPGTGKTFAARELARYFSGEDEGDRGRVQLVQFHPSYSYEDFVEGYRPRVVGGVATFSLVEGPLKQVARAAAADAEHTYVLIIDEINRGNIAKVFGELYFLLEYRGEEMRLQYSEEPFKLPSNLWVLGTMNTADKSIALVDAALRRRFYFYPFFPDQPPIQGLLRRWLARNDSEWVWLADLVDATNKRLEDRNLAVGPSYFLGKSPLAEEKVRRIWTYGVLPYIAERFFGEEERLQEYALDRLVKDVAEATLLQGAPTLGPQSGDGAE